MYFGGTIMTFALPMGAFIVAAIVLFYLFRAQHRGPRLRYLAGAAFSSFGTREPGPVPAPPVAAVTTETAVPQESVPQEAASQEAASQQAAADPETARATEESEE
jgi:hypothetical protein